MARFKKFSGGKKLSDFEPLGFELNGQEFECYSAIPGSVLLEFVRGASSADGATSAGALYTFLEAAMPEAEWERLNEVLHSPETIIELEMIADIVSFLVENFSDRPTTEPEDSSSGASTSGTSSTEDASSKA